MCYNRFLNHKINRLHERYLRIIYSDKKSSFDELLDKDESVSIHQQNMQKLGIEMFKVLNDENPQIVNDIFCIRYETSYELRQGSCFHIPSVNTIFSGTESIRFAGPKIWEVIPNYIKCLENLRDFKAAIKKWKPTSCPCRISMVLDYIPSAFKRDFYTLEFRDGSGTSDHLRWSPFDKR